MATKSLGPAASGTTDITTKADVASAITSAAGTGLTGSGGTLAVGANYRSISIPFFLSSTLTTGTKLPEWIAPVACTVVSMSGRCNSGSSATYRPVVNGSVAGTTSASTGTSVVTTSQSVSLSAGDRLGVNVVAAGTGSDLSITFWANIT